MHANPKETSSYTLMPQPVDEPVNATSEPPPSYGEGQELNEKVGDSASSKPTLPVSKELPITDDPTAPSKTLSTSSPRRVLLLAAAVHEELSAQLTQMATHLKRNAIHFSDTLARDQAIVEETKLKVESNFDSMQKERTGLRDHTRKGRSATWAHIFQYHRRICFVLYYVLYCSIHQVVVVYVVVYSMSP